MDNLEKLVRDNLFCDLYNSVLNGSEVTDEEKEFLISEIENYMKNQRLVIRSD